MKNFKFFFSVCFVLLALNSFTPQAKAQEEVIDMPTIGIGLHVAQNFFSGFLFTGGNAGYLRAYTSSVLVPINITQHFRIEPEIGMLWLDEENEDVGLGFVNGLGVFGMFQRGKVNFYAGGRFGFDVGKMEGYYTLNDESATEKFKVLSIGPTFGFEYFAGNNFSFGGEAGFRYTSSKNTIEYPESFNMTDKESTSSAMGFNSGLFLRAYF